MNPFEGMSLWNAVLVVIFLIAGVLWVWGMVSSRRDSRREKDE